MAKSEPKRVQAPVAAQRRSYPGASGLDAARSALIVLEPPAGFDEVLASESPESGPSEPLRALVRECHWAWGNQLSADILEAPNTDFMLQQFENWMLNSATRFTEAMVTDLARSALGEPQHRTFTIRNYSGRMIDLDQYYSFFRDERGAPRFMITTTDVTAHNRAVRNLQAHEEQLKLLLDAEHQSLQHTETALMATNELILGLVAARDPYTAQHMREVEAFSMQIISELECDSDVQTAIQTAALMHDVGKLGVPAELLSKPSFLTPAERMVIEDHVQLGYDLLVSAGFDAAITDIVVQHHERLDGSGYPSGLAGDEICLGARIIAVADTVVSMQYHRPYRAALPLSVVIDEITAGSAERYDPDVARVTLGLLAAQARESAR